MLGPLVILAVLSLVGGWSASATASGKFLEPVILRVGPEGIRQPPTGEQGAAPEHPLPQRENESEGGGVEHKSARTYPDASSLAASVLGGLGLAWLLYVKRARTAGKIAATCAALHDLVSNKYFVDEFYGAVIVQPAD